MKSIGTTLSKSLSTLLMLLCVAAINQNVFAEASTEPVCLFSQANYQGDRFCATTNIGFVPLRFKTASIKVAQDYQVTLYGLPFFLGSSTTQIGDNPDFTELGGDVRSFKLLVLESPPPDEPPIPVDPVDTSVDIAAALVPIISLLLSEDIDPDDFDGDGFSNSVEEEYGTDPRDPNSTPPDIDGDKIPDDIDEDRDGDGVPNTVEVENETDPNDPNDYPDLVPPVLVVTNATGLNTTSEQLLVTGSATDIMQPNSGFAELYIQSDVYPGTKFTGSRNDQTGGFSVEVPLKLGANNLTVIALDLVGNQSQTSLLVTRGITPIIVSTNPANGTVSTTDRIDISGQVRTNLPINQFTLVVNNSQVVTTGTNQDDLYEFNFANVPLQLGENRFEFSLSSDFGGDTQTIVINYIPDGGETLPAPTITGVTPANNSTLNQASFRVGAQIESSAGPLTVTVNGNEVLSNEDGLTFYSVNEVVTFPTAENSVVTVIEASDSLGKTTTETITHNRDNSGPVLVLDQAFQPLPQINQVDTSPVRFSGSVSDSNLSSVLINGQAVELSPGSSVNSYVFDVNIAVDSSQTVPISIVAYDRSGNASSIEYAILNSASASVKAILPPSGTTYLSKDSDLNVQVAARLTGSEPSDQVYVYLESAGASSAILLALNNTLASGDVVVPKAPAKQTIVFELRNAQGQRLTQDSSEIEVKVADDVELEVVRVEPANNTEFVEPNVPVEVYFNQTVDLSKLTIEVKETLHGKSYQNSDALGEDFIRAKGYELVDVNRDLELVTGQLDPAPQGAGVVFAADRLFGYNANMFVEISYEGVSLLRSRFKVRELPTFINGVINDQFGQPLRDIEVTLPALGRVTQTNGDGGFTFGYQEAGDKIIPAGSYTLIANDNFKNPSFGTINTVISVQRNRVNSLQGLALQEINDEVAFYTLNSGANNSLAGGDLEIDLSDGRVLFANTRTSGPVHAQFLPLEHAGVQMYQFAIPHWLFGLQPKGIAVEGDVSLKIKIPMLRGSYDYIDPENYQYVVLLGYSSVGQVVEPIGVAKIDNLSVSSVGKVHLSSLDYIGYAVVPPSATQDLSDYADGITSLQQLKAALQAIKLPTE